jgi:hypothetical protein
MNSQIKVIKDILSIYNTILENRNIVEASDIYDNVDFKDYVVGNSSPSKDKINPVLLQDIQNAASAAGVKVDITTAVSGHKKGTRHETGNAVDIAVINGKAVRPSNKDDVNKFVDVLVSMGYTKNSESNNDKAVLTFGFPGHDNHIHISNRTTQPSSEPTKTNDGTNDGTNSNTESGDLKPDPLVMSFANQLTKSLGLNEGKIYGKFGEKIQEKRGSIIIPKDKNSKIKSPVSGTVLVGKSNQNCKNKIFIKHNIEGETYFLEYCGVNNLSVRDNRQISYGDMIGTTDSDVIVTLYDSSRNKEYLSDFIGKENNTTTNKRKPQDRDEMVLAKILQLPLKPFTNKYDDSGKMIEKRWGSSTERKQPEPWINKLSATYNPEKQNKKITENVNRIKGLL